MLLATTDMATPLCFHKDDTVKGFLVFIHGHGGRRNDFVVGGIPALLNNPQALGNLRQQEGAAETVKVIGAVENRYAPLRLHQTAHRVDLDLTRLRLEAVSASKKTTCCHRSYQTSQCVCACSPSTH